MNKIIETKEYIIDATNRPLGRVSTEVASILNAKNSTRFAKNIIAKVKVKVTNASKLKLTGNKLKSGIHKKYSGYPGGQTVTNFENIVAKKGYSELIKHAVLGMLPKNKLQSERMKNLSIEE